MSNPKNEWNMRLLVRCLRQEIEAEYMVMGATFPGMLEAGLLAAESFLLTGNQVSLGEVYHYCEACRDYHDVTADAVETVGGAFDALMADLKERLDKLGIPTAAQGDAAEWN